MRETSTLFQSRLLRIADYRCPGRARDSRREEVAGAFSVALPRLGAWVRRDSGGEALADPNRALLFNRNRPYRIHHPVTGEDRSTVFVLPRAVVNDLLREHDPGVEERPDMPFSLPDAPIGREAGRVHARLVRALRAGKSDALAVEEISLSLLRMVLAGAHGPDASIAIRAKASRSRLATRRAHRDLAARCRETLAASFREPLGLADIAHATASSAYHLCRIFRESTGLSIHQYVLRLRLRSALESLLDSDVPLTALALDLGFSSHSHFTDAFRREFGVAPSALRRSRSRLRP